MYLDTSHNSLPTVLTNIHSAFTETATKTWTYIRLLPSGKKPGSELLKRKFLSLSFPFSISLEIFELMINWFWL